MTSPALARLASASTEYEALATDYGPLLTAAAEAEAEHKAAKAKFMLLAKDERDRCSIAEAETRADADDTIAALYRSRLITRAVADSHLEKLRQLRTHVEAIRSYVASDREADRMHAQGWTGAA